MRCGKSRAHPTFGRTLRQLKRLDAVLNEPGALGHRVVEPAATAGLVGIPEHPRRSRLFRRADDGADQRPADAAAPLVFPDIEVLEIACGLRSQVLR